MKVNNFLKYNALLLIWCISGNLSAQNLTLAEAKAIALSNNYGIIIQKMETDISALQNSAGFAGMLPSISASAAYNTEVTNSQQQYFNGDVREVNGAGANSFDAGVYLNWTIFDGMAMFATRDKLNALQAKGELHLKQEIESTIYILNAAWYQMIQAQEAIRVSSKNIEVSQERYRIAKNRETLGAAAHIDVLQAEVDLHADSAAYLQTTLQLKNIIAEINNILGRTPETQITTSEKIVLTENLNYSDLLTKATDANINLQLAKVEESILTSRIKEFKAMLYPELNLTGGYGYFKSSSEAGFVESNLNYGPSVGVTLSVPLFNGFTTNRNIDIANMSQQIVLSQTQQLQLQLNTILYNAFNQYEYSQSLIKLEKGNIDAANTNVQIALEKFNLGSITSVELREIQRSLLNAENRLLIETLNAKLAEVQLMQLSGQLSVN